MTFASPTRAMLTLAASLTVCASSLSSASAQNFNIDFGNMLPEPPPSYAAAAGQSGRWQKISSLDEPVTLKTLTGADTSVQLTASLPFGSAGIEHPDTLGGASPLLDDLLSMTTTRGDLFLSGLQPGTYTVYSYCWDPGSTRNRTTVLANLNEEDVQVIGGAWPGSLTQGVVYARHTVVVDESGSMMLTYVKATPSSRPCVGAIQIVRLGGVTLKLFADAPTVGEQGQTAVVSVQRDALNTPEPATDCILYWRFRGEPAFSASPMGRRRTLLNIFDGFIPVQFCGQAIEYYIAASGDAGETVFMPPLGPAEPITLACRKTRTHTLLAESFENGVPANWLASGLWHVSSACGGPAPDGAAFIACNDESTCTFETGAAVFSELVMPLDLTAVPPDAVVTLFFKSRVVHENFFDNDECRILVDGETNRVIQQAAEWTAFQIDLTARIGSSSTVTFQFSTIDEIDNAYLGWLIDDVRLEWAQDACGLGCQVADIADDIGAPLPTVGANSGVNEGDYNAFFMGFFDALPACDIANDDASPLPPFGERANNSGVNEGDFNCFFINFFNGCV